MAVLEPPALLYVCSGSEFEVWRKNSGKGFAQFETSRTRRTSLRQPAMKAVSPTVCFSSKCEMIQGMYQKRGSTDN